MKKFILVFPIVLVLLIIGAKKVESAGCSVECNDYVKADGCLHKCFRDNWCDANGDGVNDDWGYCDYWWDGDSCEPDPACSAPPPPPVCTTSSPGASTLVSPANGSTNTANDVNLRWNSTLSWGEGCPTNPSYTLNYRLKGSSCNGGGYSSRNVGTSLSSTLYNLNWNTSYCWYVTTSNGSASKESARWEFTTAETPVHLGTQIIANSCNSGQSGNASISGTDNPVTVVSEYRLNTGVDGIKQVALAFIPSNIRNASIISEYSAITGSPDYFMALVNINHSNPNASYFYLVNNNPSYTGPYTTGEATTQKGNASLLSINQDTRVEILNGTTLRVSWKVKFEDAYPYTPVNNLYTGAFHYRSSFWNSSPNTPGIDRALAKVRTWGVNTHIPSIAIQGPTAESATDFNLNWIVKGNELTEAQGYMWSSVGDMNLRQLSPVSTNYSLNINEPEDFSASNVGINLSSLGVHKYSIDSDVDPTEIIKIKMAANDRACNKVIQTGQDLPLSKDWMITTKGDTFTTNVSTHIVGDVDLTNQFPLLNNLNNYFSNYIAGIREESPNLVNRLSKNEFILDTYDDWNNTPPKSTGENSWYDYLTKVISRNSSISNSAISSISNNQISSAFGVDPYTQTNFKTSGNLSIGPKVECNTRSIIFVNGDLTILPNFTIRNDRNGNQMGCMFVVKGDINIVNGDPASNNDHTYIDYDKIEAFLIADGDFTTSVDSRGDDSNIKYDGLYIKGSVIAKSADFGRDLKLFNNAKQPAEIIDFDSRYTNIFKEQLKSYKYSIREKNYVLRSQ